LLLLLGGDAEDLFGVSVEEIFSSSDEGGGFNSCALVVVPLALMISLVFASMSPPPS